MSENKHLGSDFHEYLIEQAEKDALEITRLRELLVEVDTVLKKLFADEGYGTEGNESWDEVRALREKIKSEVGDVERG